MFSIFFEKVFLFFIVVNVLIFVSANDDLKDDNIDRGSRSDRGGLWFGPRLGKRSLRLSNEDNRQTFLRLLEAADALRYYYDQLQYYDPQADDEPKVTKKVIFTPKLGRSLVDDKRYESVDFTPRLGRRLADDMPATPSDHDTYRPDPDQIDSRMKYFSPRLGRNMNLSPRLGRELSYGNVLTLVTLASGSHVLVAGNEDAFESLAKQFAPQKLANNLAKLVSQATAGYDNNESYDPSDNQQYENKEDNNNEYYDEPRLRAPKKPQPTYSPKTSPMRVNLDELVEKVKDRILLDLHKENMLVKPLAVAGRPLPRRPQRHEETHVELETNAKPDQRPNLQGRQKKQQIKPYIPTVNGERYRGKKKAGQLIENHDYFKKFKLSKAKGRKDSYEDYVTPKKGEDIFISEEKLNSRSPKRAIRLVQSRENQQESNKHQDRDSTRNPHKQPKTTDDTNERQRVRKVTQYDYDNEKQNKDEKTERIEYVDDDYRTDGTTAFHEPKALTEFIGGDYKDEPLPPTEITTENAGYYQNTKRKSKVIATNMPTRERYKMSTVNYYEKLPRIAEKYNFDEPIPDRDKEEENLKPVGNPPAHINGKIEV